MSNVLWNLRIAARGLLRNPASTATALAAVALGIGANTALFSVVNGVLLEPLPYPKPDRLVQLIDHNLAQHLPRFSSSPPNFADWRREATSFEDLVASTRTSLNLSEGGSEPERLTGGAVSAGFFEVLGIRPFLGRSFLREDDRPNVENVVILGHDLWQRRYGSNPGVIGRRLSLNGEPHIVVGVMPPGFQFPGRVEAWVPLAHEIVEAERGAHWLRVTGRLKPGVTLEAAQAEMNTLAARLEREHPDANTGWGVAVHRLSDLVVEGIRPALLVLMATVGLVLLIACANVANVLLARMASRQREVAIRGALGADRRRLVQLFLTESVLLASVGGLLGLGIAAWGSEILLRLSAGSIPRAEAISLDLRVLAFAIVLSLATGVLFGLLPALHTSRPEIREPLAEGGRALGGGLRARRMRNGLIFVEVMLAVVLLIGAGLLLRSFSGLSHLSPGFSPEGVFTVKLSLPDARYGTEDEQRAFIRSLVPRLEALPGVEQAALVFPLPLDGSDWVSRFEAEGQPAPAPGQGPNSNVRFISPTYLEAMRIPLLDGRAFDASDNEGGQKVVLVNRTLAERIWKGERAVGKRITFDGASSSVASWLTVVGVVGDVRGNALEMDPGMEMYLPVLQQPNGALNILLRGAGGTLPSLAAVRQAVASVDAELPLYAPLAMTEVVANSIASQRFNAVLLAAFATLALMLASIGVYGVVSYSAAQRTLEIGLRLALGAKKGEVLRMMLGQGMLPVAAGVVAGLALAPLASRALASLLFGVGALDPVTYASVPAVLLTTATAASLVPSLRVTRVDPMTALRAE